MIHDFIQIVAHLDPYSIREGWHTRIIDLYEYGSRVARLLCWSYKPEDIKVTFMSSLVCITQQDLERAIDEVKSQFHEYFRLPEKDQSLNNLLAIYKDLHTRLQKDSDNVELLRWVNVAKENLYEATSNCANSGTPVIAYFSEHENAIPHIMVSLGSTYLVGLDHWIVYSSTKSDNPVNMLTLKLSAVVRFEVATKES
jgi:hypothetical protein